MDHEIGNSDWVQVVDYLKALDIKQTKELGGWLGLSQSRLEHMQDLPYDMVRAWLGGEDEVRTKCGPSLTWEILIEKLTIMGQKGIAEIIHEGQCKQTNTAVATPSIVTSSPSESQVANTASSNTQPVPKRLYSDTEKSVLKENEDKIRKAFAHLVRHVLEQLEKQNIIVEAFRVFVVELFERCSCIPFAEKISAIFEAISRNKLWSYSHYTHLESVAEEYLKEDTKTMEMIDSYKKQLTGFLATTKIVDYIAKCEDDFADPDEPLDINPAKYNKDYFRKLRLKLGVRITNQTLQYIDGIWRSIAELFLLPSLTAILDFVADGSLVISWLIPHSFAMLIKANIADADRFFRAQKIVQVMLDDEVVYSYDLIMTDVKNQLLKACEQGNFDTAMELLMELMDDETNFDFSQFDDTPLGAAAKRGHIELVRGMLRIPRIDINGRDKGGRTALMLACLEGETDIVSLLLNHDADVNAKHKNGSTALMWACGKGRTEIVVLLLLHGAEVNTMNEKGRTALYFSQRERRVEIEQMLLQMGAVVYAQDKLMLVKACEEGNVEKVKELLAKITDLSFSQYNVTPLAAAAKSGHLDVLEILLEHQVDVNEQDMNSMTALMAAATRSTTDVMELLVKHNADVDAKTEDGLTALMMASIRGETHVVEFLLKHKSDANATDKNGMTALMAAATHSTTDVLEVLVKHNADVDAKTEEGLTALMMASIRGETHVVEFLLKHKSDVNTTDKDGTTALMLASVFGNTGTVKQLLHHGADANAVSQGGLTALMLAKNQGKTDVVEILVKYHADVHVKNKLDLLDACRIGDIDMVMELAGKMTDFDFSEYHDTPVGLAIGHGHADVVQVLLLHEVDINGQDKDGWTPLIVAIQEERIDIVELLLKHNANVNTGNQRGITPLLMACMRKRADIVEILLKHNVDVNAASKSGRTALMQASQNGHKDVVKTLLKHNADIEARSEIGVTALMLASVVGNIAIMEILLAHNANVDAITNEGMTALDFATQQGNAKALDLLLNQSATMHGSAVRADMLHRMKYGNGLRLLTACLEGDLNQVLELLQNFTPSDFDPSQHRHTPLQVATIFGHVGIIRLLIDHGFDPSEEDKDGWTPLMVACQMGRCDVVQVLLQEYNVNVNQANKEGWTALMAASQQGNADVVKLLLNHDANPNAMTESGRTALIQASQNGHTDVVALLLKYKADVDARTENGWTALMSASQEGSLDIVECLVSNGADPNARALDSGWTSLMAASQQGKKDVVEFLVNHGADVNSTLENGWSALMSASQQGHTDIVDFLLDRKAFVNAQMLDGRTALIQASQTDGRVDVVEVLIKHNVDINIQSEDGTTALIMASGCGNTDVVHMLLENGADPNMTKKNGLTALMLASQEGEKENAELLLKYKANVNASSENGVTPLILASMSNHHSIVKLLLSHEAEVNAMAEGGITALALAKFSGNTAVVKTLIEANADTDLDTDLEKFEISVRPHATTFTRDTRNLLMTYSRSQEQNELLTVQDIIAQQSVNEERFFLSQLLDNPDAEKMRESAINSATSVITDTEEKSREPSVH